jgi:hypothetical protein
MSAPGESESHRPRMTRRDGERSIEIRSRPDRRGIDGGSQNHSLMGREAVRAAGRVDLPRGFRYFSLLFTRSADVGDQHR